MSSTKASLTEYLFLSLAEYLFLKSLSKPSFEVYKPS